MKIDMNADLGEGDAHDAELLTIVSSCNIACGGHTGDQASMAETVRAAIQNGVAVGAHPAYPDREGFGRRSGFMRGEDLYQPLRAGGDQGVRRGEQQVQDQAKHKDARGLRERLAHDRLQRH